MCGLEKNEAILDGGQNRDVFGPFLGRFWRTSLGKDARCEPLFWYLAERNLPARRSLRFLRIMCSFLNRYYASQPYDKGRTFAQWVTGIIHQTATLCSVQERRHLITEGSTLVTKKNLWCAKGHLHHQITNKLRNISQWAGLHNDCGGKTDKIVHETRQCI